MVHEKIKKKFNLFRLGGLYFNYRQDETILVQVL
jgi:hypothetical protein